MVHVTHYPQLMKESCSVRDKDFGLDMAHHPILKWGIYALYSHSVRNEIKHSSTQKRVFLHVVLALWLNGGPLSY